jgi:hypothetical protein
MNKPVMTKGAKLFEKTVTELKAAQRKLNTSSAGVCGDFSSFNSTADHVEALKAVAELTVRREKEIELANALAEQLVILLELGHGEEYREYQNDLYTYYREQRA